MKILYVTTISTTVKAFLIPHIQMLINNGFQVDIATNIIEDSDLDDLYPFCNWYNVGFSRNPFSTSNVRAYKHIKKLLEEVQYDIIHVHTPVASAITRFASRNITEKKHKMIYTAHGFHFYKGAPIINWLSYYPIEKYLSKYTDYILTINNEDYELASNKFEKSRVMLMPGVGIKSSILRINDKEKKILSNELNIPAENFVIASTGELNKNKNHKTIINALTDLKDLNITYLIIGEGNQKESLQRLIDQQQLSHMVKLLGYREDVIEINQLIDSFIFPSFREGLGMAALEAMQFNVPIITSNVHGIKDYSINGYTGFLCKPNDIDCFSKAIESLYFNENKRIEFGNNAKKQSEKYELHNVLNVLDDFYKEVIRDIAT